MAYYVPPYKKVGGNIPSVLHQIAPMRQNGCQNRGESRKGDWGDRST